MQFFSTQLLFSADNSNCSILKKPFIPAVEFSMCCCAQYATYCNILLKYYFCCNLFYSVSFLLRDYSDLILIIALFFYYFMYDQCDKLYFK